MRIVATSDTHFPFKPEQIPDGDVFIHAGDLMYTGYYDEWYPVLDSIAALPHKIKIYVPGNHDFHPFLYKGPAYHDCRKRGIRMIGNLSEYPTTVIPDGTPEGLTILGLPYVTDLPGWAFNQTEEHLSDLARRLPKADIVVSHSPPQGIMDGDNWGVRAWRLYQLYNKPSHWICGHIHECYGEHAENGTIFHNVAMCDRRYKQVNAPHIIDL